MSTWLGTPASPGHSTGPAFVLDDTETDLQQLTPPSFHYVLVTRMTKPNLVNFLLRASAIVTDIGGITCHAATIAREFGIPCVVATGSASRCIQTGDIVEVNGNTGSVRLISGARR